MKFGGVFFMIVLVLSMGICSSAHYISGYVNDAADLESANNKIITLWNPSVGTSDNVTDVIGVNGNSNSPNTYSINCEELSTPCVVGDNVSLKVYNSGDNYVTDIEVVTVTADSVDYASDLTLNSPPVAVINSPDNLKLINESLVEIDCSYSDSDLQSGTLYLYGDFSGEWALEDSYSISSGSHLFSVSLLGGSYVYSCSANDGMVQSFSENRTFTVDLTSPSIESVLINESSVCGEKSVRVNCSTLDSNGIKEVFIQANSPSLKFNQSTANVGKEYYSDFFINESGEWNFSCYSFDNAGNLNVETSSNVFAYSGSPELFVDNKKIYFSNNAPVEKENVTITATIENLGCVASSSFLVKFYEESVSSQNLISPSRSISLSEFSSVNVSVSFFASVGNSDYIVFADSESLIEEEDENDNLANNTLMVPSWQEFYGDVEAVRLLEGEESVFESWGTSSIVSGNIFVVDSESNVDWTNLLPIGRDVSNSQVSGDFSKIDSFLQMTGFSDSVSSIFSSSFFIDLLVHKKNVTNIPAVKSTENDNFYTGILWDASDDTDGGYGGVDKEDLVFVTEINTDSAGKYGNYDYELRIPAKLREYDATDTEYVYFYYDLI